MRSLSLASLLVVVLPACGGGGTPAASQPTTPPASAPASAPAASEAAAPASMPPAAPVGHPDWDKLPKGDLVEAATLPGIETPHDLDWGAKGDQPAKTLGFKNIKVLGDLSGNRVMAAMQSMEANLGQKCKLCHTPPKFEADTKDEKTTARLMFKMAFAINGNLFDGHTRVTCYTCHAGKAKPEKVEIPELLKQARKPKTPLPDLSAADAEKPAEQVFKNIQIMKGVPAGKIPMIMGLFTADLGVECAHCHVDGKWASDDKPDKDTARAMLKMTGMVGKEFFGGKNSPVNCFTCHKGKMEPLLKPGAQVD